MLKKSLITMFIGGALAALSVFPAFANTWVIDPSPYERTTNNEEWLKVEAMAELKQWTDARKDAIAALPTDAAKYDAIVSAVCDFLQYDGNYGPMFISYTFRDGKGVCADYATLTKSLCDAVGIPCKFVYGIVDHNEHEWVKVTLDGKEYYSDTNAVDIGWSDRKLSETLWAGYIEEYSDDNLEMSLKGCGMEISDKNDDLINTPAGYVLITNAKTGEKYYAAQADVDAWLDGLMTTAELDAKYGAN
ncbi:transglutaminase-like domain-containing protein [Hungatella sp.]|uniref:transglutaminase-like domain-containing protein n=1 Tax=Hungatella sp. TaxID=2613924 RepID=UPI002A82FAD5|nr:transglutaminase-like domain-containing protein [Hungatella sp.]